MSNINYEQLIEAGKKLALVANGITVYHTIRCHPDFVEKLERAIGTDAASLAVPFMGGIKIIPSPFILRNHIMMIAPPEKPGEPDRVVIYNLDNSESEVQSDNAQDREPGETGE